MKPTVLVAMSGGVDSSVAACLLQEQGYEVVGSHMKLVHTEEGVEHGCCGPLARADAEAVARVAGFPFEVVEMSEIFADTVLEDFFSEHAAGRTPNPCVRCNEQIKFGAFLERAGELGVDFVATGHYVRTDRDETGTWHLRRGTDGKDQSYMLHTLGQRELARSLFPVGGMPKAETRRHAERLGLAVADKPDSQEVCFAPAGDHGAFLEANAPAILDEGEVVDAQGRVIGEHRGLARYTIGQRRGLGLSTGERSYIVELDPAANRVVVGPAELLSRRGLIADRATWVSGSPPRGPFEASVQIRYRGEAAPAVVVGDGDAIRVEFRSAQRAIAPGQSVVVYRDDDVLGGGRIVSAFR